MTREIGYINECVSKSVIEQECRRGEEGEVREGQ